MSPTDPEPAAPRAPHRPSLVHLLSLVPEELEAHAAAHGIALRPDEARRLLAARFAHAGHDPRPEPVGRKKIAAVEAVCRDARLALVERVHDPADGFVKYLFRAPDGLFFEAVRIPLHKPGRFSVCLSTQVGCAMRCAFCATGRLGLARNLEAWEMVASFLAVRDEAPGRVTGALFQGQGEPLQNTDEVLRAARVLSHPCGAHVAGRAITISTVGLVPGILRLAREKQPYKLIVSVTSLVAERRLRLLPVAAQTSVAELAAALRAWHGATGQRITLGWVLIGGENHDAAEVAGILEHFAGVPVCLNLIDVNDAREGGLRRATDAERGALLDRLSALRIPFIRRYSGGAERHAACGMLAAVRWDGSKPVEVTG